MNTPQSVLVLLAHPAMHKSRANRLLAQAVRAAPVSADMRVPVRSMGSGGHVSAR